MEQVIDSEACMTCGHDHYHPDAANVLCVDRHDECFEVGCDCEASAPPPRLRVYKCSSCGRMVTRVRVIHGRSGHQCEECFSIS